MSKALHRVDDMKRPGRSGGRLRIGRRLACLAVTGLVAGLGLGLSEVQAQDKADTPTLRMLVSAGSAGRVFNAIAEKFTAETGINTNVVEMPLNDVRQRTVLDLATGAGEIDVVILNNTWLGEFEPYLVDISSEMSAGDGFDPTAIVPSMKAMFEKDDGALVALPVRIGGRVLAYRSDLFAEAGITEPPRSWDEFVTVAQALTNADEGRYGFVAPLRQSIELVDTWAIFVTSYGGEFVSSSGTEPAFASTQGIAATEMLVDLYRTHKVMPPESIELDGGGSIAAIQSGRAAMILAFSPWVAQMNDPAKSQFPGKVAVAPYIPSGTDDKGVSVINGWGVGVSKASKAQEAATRFVKFAASPKVQLALAQDLGNAPTVSSVFQDPDYLSTQPYATDVLNALGGATTQPSTSGWSAVAEELARTLSLAVSGTEAPSDALNDLSARSGKILQR